jgi:histone deacetylase 6
VAENHVDPSSRFQKERPDRITGILKALQPDLLSRCFIYTPMHGQALSSSSFSSSFPNLLFEEDFLRVHLFGYLQRINRYATCSCEHLKFEAEQYDSVFLSHQSALEAKQAAASLCNLVTRTVQGELHNGFAIIRPPGHHAEPGMARGYCLINNIAVAAQFARAKLGVGKILIVDWDVHHGNGTQKIFWQDPNVLYFSVHRGGHFYPFSTAGRSTMIGDGDGRGYNVNVSWTAKGMGDDEYWAVWQTLLLPMVREYSPDLILVSAGFDGADGDVGECRVTPTGYGRLTSSLVATGIPIVCALEGGYTSALPACVRAVVQALLDPCLPEDVPIDDTDAVESHLSSIHRTAAKCIRDTRQAHAPFWNFLRT